MAGVLAMATGVGHGASDPPKFDQPHAERVALIVAAEVEVEKLANEASASVDRLNTHYASRSDMSEQDLRIPGELGSLIDALPMTFSTLNNQLLNVYRDTSAHQVPKHIRYNNLTKLHLEQAHTLKQSLKDLTISTESLIGKSPEEIDHKPVAEAAMSISGTLETITGKVVDELRGKRAKDDGFLLPAVDSYKGYSKETSTLASHMYWLVYSHVYILMGMVTVGIGIFLMLVSGPLNRMMHGVR
jgi:hypothetical protein